MSITVAAVIGLRNQVLDDFMDGRTTEEAHRADLGAIAVELDRLLSPDSQAPLEERTGRVLATILAESRARHAAVTPAKTARLEFWHRRRMERLRREDPQGHEASLREEEALDAAEPDEVRMARPIRAALSNDSIVRRAEERVRAMAGRLAAEAGPSHPSTADPEWTDNDRLSWEEFAGGVPCQGCGHPFLGNETRQRGGEPWPAYRERMEPIEAEFKSRHLDHGLRWTVGGGLLHCGRCCAPHPLSPAQIEQISQILSRSTPSPAREAAVRRCGTCRKPVEGDHVCQLADLPKKLRAVVEGVLEQERGRGAGTSGS